MHLSILLPSYNNRCLDLVESLQRQAAAIDGLEYEIIVADDGGKDKEVKAFNDAINRLPHCRYIKRTQNVGRACIRNFLASQAKGDYLLFLDSDVVIVNDDFLSRYLSIAAPDTVIDGGVTVIGNPCDMRSNLRFWYEHVSLPQHSPEERNKHPYQSVHTANLFVPREIFAEHRFDERFVRYGYEDVLFGKGLKLSGVGIRHIDAPVGLDKFEPNIAFVRKTEEALETLHFFERELDGYSSVITVDKALRRFRLRWLVRVFHKIFYPMMKLQLLSKKPSITVFKLYKLCYYATL